MASPLLLPESDAKFVAILRFNTKNLPHPQRMRGKRVPRPQKVGGGGGDGIALLEATGKELQGARHD